MPKKCAAPGPQRGDAKSRRACSHHSTTEQHEASVHTGERAQPGVPTSPRPENSLQLPHKYQVVQPKKQKRDALTNGSNPGRRLLQEAQAKAVSGRRPQCHLMPPPMQMVSRALGASEPLLVRRAPTSPVSTTLGWIPSTVGRIRRQTGRVSAGEVCLRWVVAVSDQGEDHGLIRAVAAVPPPQERGGPPA